MAGEFIIHHEMPRTRGTVFIQSDKLLGHLDTVFEPDHPFQRFDRLSEKTARGPGIIDMKGGDVIIVQALKGDPITSLSFSSAAHHHAAQSLYEIARRCGSKGLLALGGGGYNRDNIAKAWTAVVRGIIEAERA